MNLIPAQHVAYNDERHDYNKSEFVCMVENRPKALLFAHAQEAFDFVRALAPVLDSFPGEAAQRLSFEASELLRKLDTGRNSNTRSA